MNPATGERQLMLVSEQQQEIQMGQQGAEQVRATIGLVQDRALQDYVSEIGTAMARDAAGGSGLPSWLSTHPTPEDRIDGMVFGENPRNGFFQNGTFLHPEMAFRMEFPGDRNRRNLARAVVAQSPGGDAMLQLELSEAGSHGAAASELFGQQGMTGTSDVRQTRINGFPATTGVFVASTEQGERIPSGTTLKWVAGERPPDG